VARKLGLIVAGFALLAMAAVAIAPGDAWATAGKRVDCGKVMSELNGGKKAKEVAKDLSISTSSVDRCKKREAAKSSGKNMKTAAKEKTSASTAPAKH
jgi:hypothetical protein